ncbi:MAG: YebC/PmpR family DNA-binding transcriptional regulator [Elusimicrobiales bacterium]|nr:YebC/PmpR family DNA-binding transcriptional regulator [Elusimicrobiales bacterium]
MGGHSHWAGIKHKKAITDAKKGKAFTKIIKEITIAARLSGGDPAHNPRLRKAMDDAKAANMPLDNVKRAVMKGTGQLPGAMYEDVMYEGYGPAQVALMIEGTTDNKNRAFSEIRKIVEEHGGNLGGSVAWMFDSKGFITVPKDGLQEDALMELAIEAGADDVKNPEGDSYEVITAPQDLDKVKNALTAKNLTVSSAEITMIPKNEVDVPEAKAKQVIDLMNDLEDHEDVKKVYSNFNIPDEILAKLDQ